MTTDELLRYASNELTNSDIDVLFFLVDALTTRLYAARNQLTMVDHTLGELGVDMESFINTEWKPLVSVDG